jgi:hypothetical protein
MPFLLEDHHNAFYVTTQAARIWFPLWNAIGPRPTTNAPPTFARLLPGGAPRVPGDPIANSTPGMRSDGQFGNTAIRVLIAGDTTVDYAGTAIGALGSSAATSPAEEG